MTENVLIAWLRQLHSEELRRFVMCEMCHVEGRDVRNAHEMFEILNGI